MIRSGYKIESSPKERQIEHRNSSFNTMITEMHHDTNAGFLLDSDEENEDVRQASPSTHRHSTRRRYYVTMEHERTWRHCEQAPTID